MMDDDPQDLLRRYSEDRSEEAFRLLVRQHSPLVYGTALRKLAGDQAAAQDVMQEVFTLLARKAASLGGVVLSGWLYRQTCRRAANYVRTESRRKQRERTAMEHLDETFLPANASLESIIAEIKRVQAGPANALTALRLRATLDRIRTDQTADFITLANDRLNRAERAATYSVVLGRWLAAEPDAALTFVLGESAGNRAEPWTSGNLVNNLFEDWMRTDLKASQAWLLKHWEHPALLEKAMGGSLRNLLSAEVAGELFEKAGKAALIEFVQAIPGERNRQAAFDSLVGTYSSESNLRNSTNRKRIEFFDLLKEFPTSAWRTSASREFLSNWAEANPAEFEKAAAAMAPVDRFQMALGHLAARSTPGELVPSLSGGWSEHPKPNDRTAREAAAMQAGMEAGMAREEILGGIGAVLLERLPQTAALAWIDAHRGEVALDDLLAEKARKEAVSRSWTENVLPEMAAILWASRITDSELRLSLCRGAFRKLCAEKPADATAWLTKPDVPQDLLEPFRSILEESR